MNYKLETLGGDTFDEVLKEASKIAINKNVTVEFDFNGIKCLVDWKTNLVHLYRDYCNANIMNWEVVGTNCLDEYEPEVLQELEKRKKEREEERVKEKEEYDEKCKVKKEQYEEKVKGIEFEIIDLEDYKKGKDAQKDEYGKAIYEYAEMWAKLMQFEMSNGKALIECVESTSHESDIDGITGFMYGVAVSVLARCWKHGEELRKWHNKEYNQEETKGVVNPAVLTIKS